jgi:transcriptional/translational regulatory protein YebC/TACO1
LGQAAGVEEFLSTVKFVPTTSSFPSEKDLENFTQLLDKLGPIDAITAITTNVSNVDDEGEQA